MPEEVFNAYTELQRLVREGKHPEARALAEALKSVCMSDEEGRDVGWLRRMQHKLSVLGAVGALAVASEAAGAALWIGEWIVKFCDEVRCC